MLSHQAVLKAGAAALVMIFAAGEAAEAQTVEGPKVSWNLSTWGKRRAFTEGAEKLAEILAARTGGNFTLRIAYGETLSKDRENLDGIKIGAIQMAHFCNFYHPGKNPAFMVFSLPFLPLGDWKANVAARKKLYEHKALVADMDRWNAMTYTSTYLPQYEFMGKGKPPMQLADWKGLRVRAGGGLGEAMAAIGAVRTTTTATEVYTGVERGTLDAASFPFTYSHVAYKIHEVADWYTANMSPGTADCPVVMSKDAWAKLPPQYQKLMKDALPEVDERQVQAYIDIDKKNLPMLEKKLKKIVYTDAQLEEFRQKAAKPVWDKWVAQNKDRFDGQELIDLLIKTATEASKM